MDLTLAGVGFIVGHLVARVFRRNDIYKVMDTILTCVGLVLIVGSRYNFFGG